MGKLGEQNRPDLIISLHSTQIGRSHVSNEQPPIPEWMLDPFVYHYTTLSALLSIVQHSALWATHIRYMNDTTEQKILWDLLRKRAEARIKNNQECNHEWLAGVLRATENPQQTDVFAVCFSKDGGDRLSQWRGYSQGSGVSIGFNIYDLQNYCGAFSARWRSSAPERLHGGAVLLPIIYVGHPESDAHLDKVIDGYLKGRPSRGMISSHYLKVFRSLQQTPSTRHLPKRTNGESCYSTMLSRSQ